MNICKLDADFEFIYVNFITSIYWPKMFFFLANNGR